MKKALLVSMMLLFSMFAPFDFSGLDFNFAFAEEGTPKNSPPVAVNDFYKTEMNTQLTVAAPGVLENDSDPEGNMLLSAKLTDPANGMVVMGTDGKFIYVPKNDFTGTDSFTYTVYDGIDASSTATVTITVGKAAEPQVEKKEETTTPKNSSPIAVDDYYITAINTQLAVVAPGIIQNDSDPDGDFLLVAISKSPSNGSLSLGTDGSFTYMPNADFSGTDSFTYSLHDGNEGSSKAVVTITVASAQEKNESKEKDKNNEDNSLDNTKKDKDVNESEEDLIVRTLSLPGGITYTPWNDTGIKPYGQYFINKDEYVNPKTGELIIRTTDFSLPARGLDIIITRVYQTFFGDASEDAYTATNFGNATRLDYPWISSKYLHLEGGQQYLIEWDGDTFEYHKQGVHFILTKNGDNTYTLKRSSGIKYQFDTSKKLTRIEDSNGDYLLFTYDGNNMIDKITDTLGREAEFTYTNGRVTSITLEGRTVTYTYTDNKLTKVTDPLGRETEYEYNSSYSNADWLITKVIYPTGGFTEYNYDVKSFSSTFYADTTDCSVGYAGNEYDSWSSVRNATTGNYRYYTTTESMNGVGYWYFSHPTMRRTFYEFDTSSLPDISAITSVVMTIYGYGVNTNYQSGISIQKGTQANSPADLADYDAFSGSEYGRTNNWHVEYPGSNVNTITFNSTGISEINKAGITKLCARLSIDYDNTPPPYNIERRSSAYFADYSGTSYDPKLVINYNLYCVSSQKIYESESSLSSENQFSYTISNDRVTQNVATVKDGSSVTKSTTTLVFAEDGTTTSKTVKDASAVQLYKIGYTYNSNLETTQENVYRGNTASITYTKKYNYDNWGNLVYYEDPMPTPNKYYYSFVNTNYENSFRDFSGSTVSGFSNSFYTENSVVSEDIHSLLCGKAFNNNGTNIESYYRYDSKGNLTNSKNKHNSGWIYVANSYDSYGNITSTTDPMSHVINFEYDDDYNYAYLTRTYASVGGITHQTTYDYNFSTGDITSQTDGEGNTTYYTYDSLGRITELEYPDTKTKKAVYDDVNNIVTTYDEKNHYAKQYFDGLGRKEKTETYMNSSLYQTATSTYNYLGLVSSTTDPLNRTTSFTYDALGRITSTTLPDGNSSSREYNDIANTLLVTYENGNTKKLFYDNLGRLVKLEEYPESGTTYSTNYYYDGLSNLTQKVLQNGYTETYVYDDLGRLTRTNYPDSTYEEINYDDARNITSTRDRKANIVTYTYDELNRLIRKSNADSTSVKYTYDKRSLLIKEEANFSAVSGAGGGGGGSPIMEANISNESSPYNFDAKLAANKEIISKRTETSKTFGNDDGTYTSVFHVKSIHFKNKWNDWEEIDARIVKKNGKYKVAKNKFDLTYADNNLYSISNSSNNINFIPTEVRINGETIIIDSTKINWNLIDDYHVEGKITDNIYLWIQSHEAFIRHAIKTDRQVQDFEAVYLVSISGYSCENQIESKYGKNYYKPDEKGNLYFKDSEGNKLSIPQPVMWNDENSSSAIMHELWEENGKLYYKKYATEEGKKWLLNQKGVIYLDSSSTFYADISDCLVQYSGTWSDSWSSVRNATSGNGRNYTVTTSMNGIGYWYFSYPTMRRTFYEFDTSSLPDNSQIDSVVMTIYGYGVNTNYQSGISIQKGTQANSPADLADYDAFSGSEYGRTNNWHVEYPGSNVNTITFNSTGISEINKAGITKLCARLSIDYDNTPPPYNIERRSSAYFADYSGTSYDPKLVINYTPNQAPGKPVVTSVDGTIKPPQANGYNTSDPDGNNLTHRWRVEDMSSNTLFNSGWFESPNDINGTDFTGLTLGNTYKAYLESNDSELVTSSDPYEFAYTGKIPLKSTITSIGNQQFNNSYITQNPPLAYGFNSSDLDGDNLLHRWRVVKGETIVPEGFETEKYKRPIAISNSGSSLTNYQIKITLTSSNFDFSKTNSNGEDIRFSDDSNTTTLNYWIEKWDAINQQAVLWVKVPSIPSGSSNIFVYYGSQTLQSESNGTNTFLFFDDFTGSSLNSSKWEIDAVGTIDETVNNEIILTGGRSSSSTYWIYNTTDTGNQHRAKINGSQFIIPSQCTIEWNGKAISGDMAQTGIGLIKSTDNTVRAYLAISDGSGGNGCAPSLWGFVEGTTGSGTITVGQYKNFRLIKNGSAITGYQKDTSSESWTQMLTGTSSNIDRMAITQGTYGGYTYEQMALDNIKVREYSSAEPTIVVGSQKTLDAEIVYFNSEWFDNPNDINGTELKGLISDKDYKAYLDVNDSVNVVSSDPFIFTLESSEPQFTNTYETSITYTYDSRGRLTSETSDINGSTYTTSFSYDDASNITSITYPSTNSYSYTYDDVNRITALTGYASFAYTATNMIDTISYQNGVTTDYTYDVRDRPTGIAIGSLETLNYTYDPSGNVLKMNDWEYEYDGLNRLEAATSVFDLDYTYDALGNRTQQTENTVTTSYTYNTLMRLTAKTVGGEATYFTYDPNGNMTEKEDDNSSYTYTWDINNRLREVRDDGNLLFEYLYDSQGRRVKSHNHSTGVTTTYIYAGINVIHEATSSESTDYLYANGMRIAKKTGATVKYFHSDHLGSTRLVTDSSGQPTFESDYKPFGQDANATGIEKYTFTGQYSEADIGLYYFGARWYDASLGRFISEDPIKGSMISSQSQNPYVYCMNNPLRFIDPSGMMGDIPRMSLDEWLGPSDRSASDLLNEMRASQDYFSGLVEEAYHDIMFGSDDYHDYDNLNPVLSDKQNPIEVHGNFSAAILSIDYSIFYDSKNCRLEDKFSVDLGAVIGVDILEGISKNPISYSVMLKDIHTDLDTYIGTPVITVTGGYHLGAEGSWGDTNGDGSPELLSSGIGYNNPGISTSFGTPVVSGPIFSNGGAFWNVLDIIRGR
ncbi:MAG TPA: DUF2341 domain-containing protein [Methanofastidiosum sp.]|nr:DUF2341 domain-containing protein [Methanofastidiosum sp.]HOR88386.1 DUF2341 domain-containing protein [Methanofastidiosum sp.]HPL00529.1 DUF2341 domain-containing protein [Methanofastidiosum sp.]